MCKKSMLWSLLIVGLLIPQVSFAQVENLIQNASFEEQQDIPGPGWGTWNPAQGAGSTATIDLTDSIDGIGSVRIDPKGTANWHFYLTASPIDMEVGATYTLSFWAKAPLERGIGVLIKGVDNAGPNFCVVNPTLTNEWIEYTATGVCTQPVCKVDFSVGGEIPIWLDFIHLYKGEYVQIDPIPAHDKPEPLVKNLIYNGNFEIAQAIPGPGWGTWNPAAGDGSTAAIDSSDSIDGSSCIRIDPRGDDNWHFYLIARPVNLTVGETYTLSFWAKADEARNMGVLIKGNDNSGPDFCTVDPDLTTEWTEYTVTDVCQDDTGAAEKPCKIDFSCGSPILGRRENAYYLRENG